MGTAHLPHRIHLVALAVTVAVISLAGGARAQAPDTSDGVQTAEPELIAPELVEFKEATYPPAAVADDIEGSVLMELDIDVEGHVEAVRVIRDETAEGYGLADAAVEAAKLFTFTPALAAGQPIPVTITYKYGFKLEARVSDSPTATAGDDGNADPSPTLAPAVVNFSGVILERGTRDPLVGTLITVFRGEGDASEGYEATTDAEGAFSFAGLDAGPWRVLVDPSGFFPFRTEETVTAGERTAVTYYVEKGSYNPFDVLVEGERPKKDVSRHKIVAAEIEKIPGTFGDPVKVVTNLPGVARTQFGDGAIVVRGSSPEDTRVYIDGVLVPLLYHFGGLRSVVPLGMVESITFMPGNFSVYYGRAIGGVLDVDLKRLKPETIHGYADINLFDSGAYVEAPVTEDLAVAVAARRSYIDTVLPLVIPDEAPINLIAAPRYYDVQALVTYRPIPSHELKLFFFTSNDTIELLFKNPADVSTQLDSGSVAASTGFMRGVADYTWTPSTEFANDLKLSAGNDLIDFSLGSQIFFKFDLLLLQARDNITAKLGKYTTVTTGLDVYWSRLDIEIQSGRPPKEGEARQDGPPDLEDTIYLKEEGVMNHEVGAYFEVELNALDRLKFVPGVRADYNDYVGSFTYDPRLVARYELNKQWTLKGGVGLFHQPPSPDETAEGFGNPELGPEEAVHESLGVEYSPLEYLSVDATAFYKDLNNLVSSTDETVVRDGKTQPLIYNNGGEGRVYGLEFLVRHEFANGFFGWITYTLSRAERIDSDSKRVRLFDYDQTHILTVVGSYQLPRNWELSGRWRLVSGNPTTPVVGSIYDSKTDQYNAVFGAINSARLEPFSQLDLRVDKRWIYDLWRFNVYMDVQNVTNRSNVEGYEYNFDFSRKRAQQGLPVLPIFGFRADF